MKPKPGRKRFLKTPKSTSIRHAKTPKEMAEDRDHQVNVATGSAYHERGRGDKRGSTGKCA